MKASSRGPTKKIQKDDKKKSNIIKGKIQHDETFAAAAAIANLKKN